MKIKDLIVCLQKLDQEQELYVVDEDYMDAFAIDGARIQHSKERYEYMDGKIPYSDNKEGYVI